MSEKISAPSKRVNFSNAERDSLKRLLLRYPILTTKETNAGNQKKKKDAWEKLTEEFNAIPEHKVQRSVVQIRKLWDNLKSAHKGKLMREKIETRRTGGGPEPERTPDDPFMNMLADQTDIELRDIAVDSEPSLLQFAGGPFDSLSQITGTAVTVNSQVRANAESSQVVNISTDTSNEQPCEESHVDNRDCLDSEDLNTLEENIWDDENRAFSELALEHENRLQNSRKRTTTARVQRTREALIDDLVQSRKKFMELEHEAKVSTMTAESNAKVEASKAKQKAAEAKREAMIVKMKFYELKMARISK